ncbi:THUMP domain-containing protein [Desulfuromonas carbonis]|uniref:THUMP domain-containing class I SAM-dependent RNA methyltransferase n=1 Tax=Desulfuromonas sp. DDH964 TaxID=1823759 RepID=UPI00078DB195|nr:class I SAM-dependent RNA methyltransferase [Desulfuromonas sp. DDH964]AMV73182.1 23S rRNA (2-N-methyl-G2445)-methyltransferase [Desulfuromonas sp. DDH964]
MKKDRERPLFAITAPGLETLCAGELTTLGLANRPVPGGVEFRGGLREVYLANLWLRTATRVVVRLESFRCRAFPELFQRARRLPWGQFLRPQTRVEVSASSRGSRLFHTDRIADTVREAITQALGEAAGSAPAPEQRLLVRFEDDICQLSVDSSGELLHRRGYRQDAAPAPLRETLAAAMLLCAGWDGRERLIDPLCGSGTLPIEAALLAGHRPPGANRSFAFMAWPGYRAGLWQALQVEAMRHRADPGPLITGSDHDPVVLGAAQRNAERAGVDELLQLRCAPLETLQLPPGPGLLIANPPYGARLGRDQDLERLFAALGTVCRRGGAGWRCLFLTPDAGLARATGLDARPLAQFSNGGIEVVLFQAAMW